MCLAPELEREFARQCDVAKALDCAPTLAALTARAATVKSSASTREPIRIGLFDYRNPSFPSNNIGDFFQTLGVVAQLRRYRFDKLTAPAALCSELGRATAIEGLRGIGHALELVATLALMCDPHDIGRSIGDASPYDEHFEGRERPAHLEQFSATVYLFDNVPGGVGLAERIYERAATLGTQAAELIRACPCPLGCPSCVGATAVAASPPSDAPRFDRKTASIALASRLGLLPVGLPPSGDRGRDNCSTSSKAKDKPALYLVP